MNEEQLEITQYETNENNEQILKIREDNFKLIKSIEELKEFGIKCNGRIMAFDTETTGLSYGKDKIVGFSMSLDSYSGVYVPIRHQIKHITKEKIDKLDENGNLYDVCRGSWCSMEAKYYIQLGTVDNDDHGTGIILSALYEIEKLNAFLKK